MKQIKEFFYYTYGKGSHMNIFGKVLIGLPLLPFVLIGIATYMMLDFLFSKSRVDL